jgi:hypothetical protein
VVWESKAVVKAAMAADDCKRSLMFNVAPTMIVEVKKGNKRQKEITDTGMGRLGTLLRPDVRPLLRIAILTRLCDFLVSCTWLGNDTIYLDL